MLAITLIANEVGAYGGMERQLAELVRGCLERGVSVTVIARRCDVKHDRLTFRRIPGPRRPFVVAFPWFFLAASVALSRERAGLRHVTGAIVGNRADVATVHLCHHAIAATTDVLRTSRSTPGHRLNARVGGVMSRAAEKWCYRSSRLRALVGLSTAGANELAQSFPSMSHLVYTIPNGVDTERYRPGRRSRDPRLAAVPLEQRLALFVGSEWEGKGLRFAIEALAMSPSWHLAVVGNGDRRRYQALAASMAVADRVHFLGAATDVAPIYQTVDAFVLPSAYETFSLVTFEAAASGLPILATPTGGASDLVKNGVNGWFIERDGRVISRYLNKLSENPSAAKRMGESARKAAIGFPWTRMIDAYLSLYNELAIGTDDQAGL